MKKLLATILAGTLLLSVCGCGNSGEGENTADSGKTQLVVGNWPDQEGNKTLYDNQMKTKEAFETAYPDIEIIPDEYGYDVQTFTAKAEGGTLPTLYTTHFTEVDKIVDMGYAADITDAAKEYGYYDNMNEVIFNSASRDGKLYLVPGSMYSLGLILNMDLFEQAGLVEEDGTPMAPKTFDELIEVGRTIKEKTGVPAFVFPTTEGGGGWNFTVLAWNFGGTFMEQDADGNWQATFNSPECIAALQYLKDLKWEYDLLPQNTLVNNAETSKLIGTNQVAMSFGHPSQARIPIRNYGMSKDSLGYAQMPAGPERHVTLIGGDYRVFVNDATPEEIDAGFKWLEFIGVSPNLTEDAKVQMENNVKTDVENGMIIGIEDLSLWGEDSEVYQYNKELRDKYCNVNINHIKLYNDKTGLEFQTEEPVCAQDLYQILDRCIQNVLNNENADCAQIMADAANEFQTNYLDYENEK
ncbi:MAG TPA: extracellular solute-binding protein [Candidatus Avimonoglobus intestinipullorum]|uniref:Extracellular solute-binding protein n=1 Tax=Candidatus Avimonoglobus intestinipullorum TaxID=2840699 RepID=A0A9D1LTB8_9FIRM|nr:extracellular solute-binding protein [Candidatus Avimonoglobus intestinipullorum]